MGELVELEQKVQELTVDEVLAIVGRQSFDEIVVVGLHKGALPGGDDAITIYCSDMHPARAYWLLGKAQDSALRSS